MLMALVTPDGQPLVNPDSVPEPEVMNNLELTAHVAAIIATLVRMFGIEFAQHVHLNAVQATATLTALHASLEGEPYVPPTPTDADVDRWEALDDDGGEATDWSDIS